MVSINSDLNNISSKLPKIVGDAFKNAGFSSKKIPIAYNISDSNEAVFDLSDKALEIIGDNADINTLGILSEASKQENEVQKFANYYI